MSPPSARRALKSGHDQSARRASCRGEWQTPVLPGWLNLKRKRSIRITHRGPCSIQQSTVSVLLVLLVGEWMELSSSPPPPPPSPRFHPVHTIGTSLLLVKSLLSLLIRHPTSITEGRKMKNTYATLKHCFQLFKVSDNVLKNSKVWFAF